MKLLFKDGQTLTVQSINAQNGKMVVNVINNVYQQLKHLFTDPLTTGKITVEDDTGKVAAVYENYTIFGSITEKNGGIFIVEMEQEGRDANTRIAELEKKEAEQAATIQKMKEEGAGEGYNSMLYVAKIQAQSLDDSDAINVKNLYPKWKDIIGEKVDSGYKFLYGDVLYKVRQDNTTIQEHYIPGQGTESLYEAIDETHAGTIDDPIPYNNNMELIEGKYYIQNGVIYLCTRGTGQAVYNNLSELVGLYVQVAE